MRVVIAGGTGFIGQALTNSLLRDGHEVVVVSRGAANRVSRPGLSFVPFDGQTGQGWSRFLDGAFALVNLSGENIASGYWTAPRKSRILESRLRAGRAVMDALSRVAVLPQILIQGSATGYYGDRGEAPTDEDVPPGSGFLAEVATQWEASTVGAEGLGVRRVLVRTAVVLGAGDGVLSRLLPPYRFFLGGPLGSGRQYFPWIHLDDEVAAIRFLIERPEAAGPFNLAAPEAATHNALAAALGQALGRPAFWRVPEAVLRLALGEMARELLLSGVRAVPRRLLTLGFRFRYPTLAAALSNILTSPRAPHA